MRTEPPSFVKDEMNIHNQLVYLVRFDIFLHFLFLSFLVVYYCKGKKWYRYPESKYMV